MAHAFKTGDKITITEAKQIMNRGGRPGFGDEPDEDRDEYISQVDDVITDHEVLAAVPIYHGRLLRLPEMSSYNCIFHTVRGMIHYFGRITSYVQQDNDFFMVIRLLSKGEPMQRREFFRFDCNLPLKFNVADRADDDEFDGQPLVMFDGVIRDISGGGLCFLTNENIRLNDKIRCMTELGADLLIIVGKVLKKDVLKGREYKFEYRVTYSGIRNTDKERIVRYIFNEQRRQLKAIR